MKKYRPFMFILMLFMCVMCNSALAVSESKDFDVFSENILLEISTVRKIHAVAVEKDFCTVNSNGEIEIVALASDFGVSEDDYVVYLESIENLNDIIELGVITVDVEKGFDIQYKPDSEVIATITERDRMLRENHIITDNRFDTTNDFQILDQRAGFSTLLAYDIAEANYYRVAKYMATLAEYDPVGCKNATILWWVAKVQTNGDWDYKSTSTYGPASREWNAIQKYQTSVKTTEWFGNYNYGLTGSFLFSKQTLLDAGDAISYLENGIYDQPEDKEAIIQGFNEAP